jgi:hypothetical protein
VASAEGLRDIKEMLRVALLLLGGNR